MKEYTVHERFEIVSKALPKLKLTKKQQRDLDEILYTTQEAGGLWGVSQVNVELAWRLIELVRSGNVTKEMSL